MSEDRFKQARRSLIDRHNQRQQQGGGTDTFDGDFEDEATAMVSIDAGMQFAPPPNFGGHEEQEDSFGEHTEMISLDQHGHAPPQGAVQMRSHASVQPSYDQFGQQGQRTPQAHQPAPSRPPHAGVGAAHGQGSGYSPQPTAPAYDLRGMNPNQSLVIGDQGGYEGNTAFVNINDFAAGESFTPDDTSAGYEGSTQFVNLAALQAGAAAEAGGPMPIENDPVLRQGYQYGPESIQHGDITLVFAQNLQGRPVVLKRIWDGDPNGMPMPLRQRIAALDQIRHPQLVGLNGMIAAPTGAWVELNRPAGYRLTDLLAQNGPQPLENVTAWIKQAAEVLHIVHQQGFVYANLTTDALWIQEDGRVILEPFDILEFEHRGNLGAFGPAEMNFPPDQRQLYPSTDVYSLAAIFLAGFAGLPLNLAAVQALDKKLNAAIMRALQQNPQERQQSMVEFADSLSKGGKSSGPNMKIVIGAVAAVMVVGLGAAYLLKPKPKPPTPAQNVEAPVEEAAVAGVDPLPPATNGAAPGTNGAGGEVAAAAVDPGSTSDDPRLTIKTSLALNPVTEDLSLRPDPDNPEAATARLDAREAIKDVEKLTDRAQQEKYMRALELITQAIRLSGGATAKDEELLEKLDERESLRNAKKEKLERIDEALRNRKLSSVKSVYPQLSAIDASANEMSFFHRNKSFSITVLNSDDKKGDD